MKMRPTLLLILTSLLLPNLQKSAIAQGSLTPPGTPSPTMKTLAQVEPRIPISSLPFTIDTSGSYYVTSNLVGTANSDGIYIWANDVTIDLNGFALIGPTNGVFEYGINGASSSNVVITHGSIRGWTRSGLNGVSFTCCRVLDIAASSNGLVGIVTGDSSLVERCSADHNGLNVANQKGISVGSGCTVRDCIVSGQNGTGGLGIQANANSLIQHCVVQNNSANNGTGINPNGPSVIEDCVVANNQGGTNYIGIIAVGCQVRNCLLAGNSGDGIRVAGASSIIDNNCSNNGGNGIFALNGGSRIDGNHFVSNGGRGIALSTANSCVVMRNTASANTGGDYPAAGSNIGPIQSPSTATSPWANFSF